MLKNLYLPGLNQLQSFQIVDQAGVLAKENLEDPQGSL
jgi:hypothetical protein